MTEKNSKEEIDILSLFSLIGEKTNSLFVSIINFFINILNLITQLLYLLKRNYLLVLGFLIVGNFIGYIYNKKIYQAIYKTTLTLSPNFGSTYHLYKNIKFYQSLIEQKDFEKLSIYLNIDSIDAKSLISISIEPYKNELYNLKNFNKLLNAADSTTGLSLSYDDFENKIPFESYAFHVLTLQTIKSEIPKQLEESIINYIENNKYFKNKKKIYLENLIIKKKHLKASVQKLDTLLFSKESKSLSNFDGSTKGPTILLKESQDNDLKYKLFSRYEHLNNELIFINNEIANKEYVINKISSFKHLLKSKSKFKSYIISVISLLIALIIILAKDVIKNLNNNSDLLINKLNYKKYNSTD